MLQIPLLMYKPLTLVCAVCPNILFLGLKCHYFASKEAVTCVFMAILIGHQDLESKSSLTDLNCSTPDHLIIYCLSV